jgi:hypothetical protein
MPLVRWTKGLAAAHTQQMSGPWNARNADED